MYAGEGRKAYGLFLSLFYFFFSVLNFYFFCFELTSYIIVRCPKQDMVDAMFQAVVQLRPVLLDDLIVCR